MRERSSGRCSDAGSCASLVVLTFRMPTIDARFCAARASARAATSALVSMSTGSTAVSPACAGRQDEGDGMQARHSRGVAHNGGTRVPWPRARHTHTHCECRRRARACTRAAAGSAAIPVA
eukprot:5514363-Prymnesium_polylepis.1